MRASTPILAFTKYPMKDVMYSRAFTMCVEALHALCCEQGDIRSRLAAIDKEFFSLSSEQFPDFDGVRSDFDFVRGVVRKLQPRGGEGSIEATISRSQLKTLEGIAQRIWDIHQKVSAYMNETSS